MKSRRLLVALFAALFLISLSSLTSAGDADDSDDFGNTEGTDSDGTVNEDLGKSRKGSKTDDETAKREEESIQLDGLNVAQMKEMRDKAEKHVFQAEVSRMMKLIINSLYRNKDIFLRELISNASDALDKIRLVSLTDDNALSATDEMSIRIKADKDNNALHITDTGIGMTAQEMISNLGTIAKSGTSEFLEKIGTAKSEKDFGDLIGQFGVGFYSAFLVADKVVVTSKSNDDDQYIWESDSASFTIAKDPRGNTLKRGTTVSLFLKPEAKDFLEEGTLQSLVEKYSQFINFQIYMWKSKTESVEEPIEEEEKKEEKKDDDEDAAVEEEKEDDKKKTKTVERTVWDWDLLNTVKPVWSRKPSEVDDKDYLEFYKSITRSSEEPLGHIHFNAEGEVTFKSILYVPKTAPHDALSSYGKKVDHIKLYVRRVFITDDFSDMMPKYLSFIRGVVDSDDLPLNVSRENLQQHKLLKVIKRKLVRKALDMIKKLSDDDFKAFWNEFSTQMKLGVIEDSSNRNRLAKMLRFRSSHEDGEFTPLTEYLERMKEKQEQIYFIGAPNLEEAKKSPFTERLIKKGYEVLYMVEPIDEYTLQSLPEFEGKKFANVAKDDLQVEESEGSKERMEALDKDFKPLLDWMKEDALKDRIEKAALTNRLLDSPCGLVASKYGWSANMERIMTSQAYAKTGGGENSYYQGQKKTLELNPRHPLVKELKRRYDDDKDDAGTKELAEALLDTATIRSGFQIADTSGFVDRMEKLMRTSYQVDLDEKVEEDPDIDEAPKADEEEEVAADPDTAADDDKEEL